MKKYNKKEIYIAILTIFLIVISFLIFTKTFFSGYHLVDDHEFIRILTDFNNMGFLKTMNKWVINSFSIRFRPLYFVIRVILTKIFGLNFYFWYLWKAIEVSISAFFLYFFARNLKCSKCVSFLFSMICFIGAQSAVLYRLGPQEVTGLLFMSIAMFFITEYSLYNKNKINLIIIYLNLFLMSLMKESFVLMIPPLIILKIAFECKKNKKIIDVILENKNFIVINLLLFVIEMFFIVFVIGTDKISYAGFSTNTQALQYIEGIKNSLLSNGIYQPIFVSLISIGIIMCSTDRINRNDKKCLNLILLFVLNIFVFQLLLHAKSTMFERYIIPMSIAYSFLICILPSKLLKKSKKYFIIVIIMVLALFKISYKNAIGFSSNGFYISEFQQYILNHVEKNSKILSAMDYELSYSNSWFLSYYGFNNVFYYGENNNPYDIYRIEKKEENEFDVIIISKSFADKIKFNKLNYRLIIDNKNYLLYEKIK